MSYKKIPSKFWGVCGLILLVILIGGIITSNNKKSESSGGDEKKEAGENKLNLSEMETLCHEKYLANINSFFESKGIDYNLIYVTNYNQYFNNEYQKTIDGTPIALLSWNGKNNDSVEPISFMCWGQKNDDGEPELLLLESGGETIIGDTAKIYGE